MTQPTYRVAIIGTGGIARTHAGYYEKNPRTTIVAAADIRPNVLAAFCDAHKIAARYEDYQELLEKEKPDLVSICTWTATHPEVTIAAAEAGVKAILCEKPMGAHLGDVRRAVALCQQRGIPLAIHHQGRFSPRNVAVRQHIAEGAIGTPMGGFARSSGGFLNNGTHAVDGQRYYLGDPAPAWVMAQLERRTNRYERGVLIEDRITAVIAFENGYHFTLESDMGDPAAPGGTILFGTEGMIRMDRNQCLLINKNGTHPIEPAPTTENPLDALLTWLEGGPESRNAGHIALVAHEIMMAAYESARVRARVSVPLGPEVERSPLYTMVEEGMLPVTGERYDIRSVDALRYALQREGIPLTGKEHLEGDGSWTGAGLPGRPA